MSDKSMHCGYQWTKPCPWSLSPGHLNFSRGDKADGGNKCYRETTLCKRERECQVRGGYYF